MIYLMILEEETNMDKKTLKGSIDMMQRKLSLKLASCSVNQSMPLFIKQTVALEQLATEVQLAYSRITRKMLKL